MPGVSTNMRIDDVNKEYIYLMLAISLQVPGVGGPSVDALPPVVLQV